MGAQTECKPIELTLTVRILWCPLCKRQVRECTICEKQIKLGEPCICANEPEDWDYHCHKKCYDEGDEEEA